MLRFEEVEKIILAAMDDENGVLSEWEHDFVKSTSDRMAKYDEKTTFTEKQLEIIKRINDKLNGK